MEQDDVDELEQYEMNQTLHSLSCNSVSKCSNLIFHGRLEKSLDLFPEFFGFQILCWWGLLLFKVHSFKERGTVSKNVADIKDFGPTLTNELPPVLRTAPLVQPLILIRSVCQHVIPPVLWDVILLTTRPILIRHTTLPTLFRLLTSEGERTLLCLLTWFFPPFLKIHREVGKQRANPTGVVGTVKRRKMVFWVV